MTIKNKRKGITKNNYINRKKLYDSYIGNFNYQLPLSFLENTNTSTNTYKWNIYEHKQ